MKDVTALSYSAIGEYDQCPQKFKFHRLDGLPEPEGPALLVGSAVHKVLESYVAYLWNKRLRQDVEKVPEFLDRVRGDTPTELMDEVEQVVMNYCGSHLFDADLYESVEVELRVAFDKDWALLENFFDRKSYFRGVIDRVNVLKGGEVVEIVDYKSGHRAESESDLPSNQQLRVYRRVARLLFPKAKTIRVALDFVRIGRVIEAEFPADEEDGVPQWVASKFEAIRGERKWAPKVTGLCGWCGYRPRCQAYQAASQQALAGGTPVVTPENALEIARKVRLVDSWVADAKAALKVHVEQNGPLEDKDAGEVLAFHAQDRTEISRVREAVELLLEAGVPRERLWAELGLSKSAIEKLCRGARVPKDQVKELLGKVAITSPATVFRWKEAS